MKLVVCDNCRDTFMLPRIDSPRACSCGRIKGHYCDHDAQGIVYLKQLEGCRVIGVDTNLLRGRVATSESYVMGWVDSGLVVYVKGKPLNKKLPKDYVLDNAAIFLDNSIGLLEKRQRLHPSRKIGSALKAIKKAALTLK